MICTQNLHNASRCINRNRALFHHNLITLSNAGNHTCSVLDVFQIGGSADAIAKGFRWRIDGDEDKLCLFDGRFDVRGEK